MIHGRLYVVPNLLGVVAPDHALPARTIAVARRLEHYIVENAKPARALLKSLVPALPVQHSGIGRGAHAATLRGVAGARP